MISRFEAISKKRIAVGDIYLVAIADEHAVESGDYPSGYVEPAVVVRVEDQGFYCQGRRELYQRFADPFVGILIRRRRQSPNAVYCSHEVLRKLRKLV